MFCGTSHTLQSKQKQMRIWRKQQSFLALKDRPVTSMCVQGLSVSVGNAGRRISKIHEWVGESFGYKA